MTEKAKSVKNKQPLKVSFPHEIFENYKNKHEEENTLQSEAAPTSSITKKHQHSSNKKYKDKKDQNELEEDLKLLNKRNIDKQADKSTKKISSSLNNVEQISLNETNLSKNRLHDYTVFDDNNTVENFHNMTNLQKTLTCLNKLNDVEKNEVVNLITFSTNLNDKRGKTRTDQNQKMPSEKQSNQTNNNGHETNREHDPWKSKNENRSVLNTEMESNNAELNFNTITTVDSASGGRFIDKNRHEDLNPLLLPTIAEMCNILNKYNFGFDITDDINTFLHQLYQLQQQLPVFCQLSSDKQRQKQQFYGLMQSNDRYINTQTQDDEMTWEQEIMSGNAQYPLAKQMTSLQFFPIVSMQALPATVWGQETTAPLVQMPVISETASCQFRQAAQIQPASQPVQETAPATPQHGLAHMPYQDVSAESIQAKPRRGHIKRRFSTYTDFPSSEISSHGQRQHPYHTESQDTVRVRPQLVQNYHDVNNDFVIAQQQQQTQQQHIATQGQINDEQSPNEIKNRIQHGYNY